MEPTLQRGVLASHLLATLLQSSVVGAITLLPVLALLHFNAAAWQVALVTAAMPTLLAGSILWGELLHHLSVPRYLALFWLVTYLPLGMISFANDFSQMLILFLVCAIGAAGWSPVEGKLLQTLYPGGARGRVMGAINVARLLGGMISAFAFGWAQERDPNAFRIFLPSVVLLHLAGSLLLAALARRQDVHHPAGATDNAGPGVPALRRLIDPIARMTQILRADRRFFLYERAFMTYGIGWMICTAVLPIFAIKQLGMNYAEVANSTQVALQLAMLVVTLPMGWVNDRLGPVRTSALAFAALGVYPLALVFSRGVLDVTLITIYYGAAMTGVQMGWMLGPISLAGTPQRVPHYVAIHATLVGLRAIVGQAVGVGLYELTGSVLASFLVAAASFVLAAMQMWHLQRSMTADGAAQGREAATIAA